MEWLDSKLSPSFAASRRSYLPTFCGGDRPAEEIMIRSIDALPAGLESLVAFGGSIMEGRPLQTPS
jgi:hypothetical protein